MVVSYLKCLAQANSPVLTPRAKVLKISLLIEFGNFLIDQISFGHFYGSLNLRPLVSGLVNMDL